MSAPRTAKTARRPAVAVPPMGKRAGHAKAAERQATAKRAGEAPNGGSAQAKRLAAEPERALAKGRRGLPSTQALQALMAALCKTHAAQIEAGGQGVPLPQRGGATRTGAT